MHCFCLDTYIYPFFLTFQLGLTADKQCNQILLHLTMTCRLHLLGHREGIAHLLKLRPAKVRHHARNVFEGVILETPLWYPLAHLQNLCFKIEKRRKPLNKTLNTINNQPSQELSRAASLSPSGTAGQVEQKDLADLLLPDQCHLAPARICLVHLRKPPMALCVKMEWLNQET